MILETETCLGSYDQFDVCVLIEYHVYVTSDDFTEYVEVEIERVEVTKLSTYAYDLDQKALAQIGGGTWIEWFNKKALRQINEKIEDGSALRDELIHHSKEKE